MSDISKISLPDGSSYDLKDSGAYRASNPSGYTSNTGTVTQVATSGAITGGPITTSGTITHSTSAGYKHIPSGGSSGQALIYGGSSGTATWGSVPAPSSIYETSIQWGNQNLSNAVSPIDMAMYNEFGSNRLAFLPANCWQVEYSRDGGSTWTDYGLTDEQKINIGTSSQIMYTGATSNNSATNFQLRVTITGKTGVLYTACKKIILYCSTNGCWGCKCKVEYNTDADTTYVDLGTCTISGWGGWNSISLFNGYYLGGSASQTTQPRHLRLTFWYTEGKSSSYPNAQLSVSKIRLFGNPLYSIPSTMADTGHIYTYDYQQNTTFPNGIKSYGGDNVLTVRPYSSFGTTGPFVYVGNVDPANATSSMINAIGLGNLYVYVPN